MSPHTCYQITVHTTLNKVVSGYYKKYPFIAVMSLAPFILCYIIFKKLLWHNTNIPLLHTGQKGFFESVG